MHQTKSSAYFPPFVPSGYLNPTHFRSSLFRPPPTKGKRQRRVRMMSTVDAGTGADIAGGTDTAGAGEGKPSADEKAGDGEDSISEADDDVGGEAQPDYYGALGVDEEASPTEIKVCWAMKSGGRDTAAC